MNQDHTTGVQPGSPVFLEPDFRRATSVWWAIAWRLFLVAFAINLLATLLSSRTVGQPQNMKFLNVLLSIVLLIPCGIYIVKIVLKKDFGEFSIRLIAKD